MDSLSPESLWEEILNGDSPALRRVVEGVLQPVAPTTAKQKLARKNELKAHGTLLMAFPDKHQLKFNSYKDAKTLTEAIDKRRNKADLEEQSLDDSFNRLKIYEAEVKHSYSTFTTIQNLAFVSSSNTNSTTESVSAAASISVVCAKMPVSSLPNVDSLRQEEILVLMDLLLWVLICLRWSVITATGRDILKGSEGSYDWSFQAEEEPANYALMDFSSSSSSSDNELKFNSHKDAKKLIEAIEKSTTESVSAAVSVSAVCAKMPVSSLPNVDTLSFDMSKVECYNCHMKGYFARKCRSPKDSKRNGTAEPQKRNVQVETSTSNALVSQCIEFVEARLLVYKQNESIFKEDIKLLKLEVQLRDNALVTLRQQLEKAEQEKR
uniref:CCHC-type domain-containing protein n=1 Tax=Tanacetum cinerariifolium TaxID=118510 RepID=A0A699JKE7_TANCI|nr:hypothetical protein [Tanacetum cinerariifolium]